MSFDAKNVTGLSDSQNEESQNSDNVSEDLLLQDDHAKEEMTLDAKDVAGPSDSRNLVLQVSDNVSEDSLLADDQGREEISLDTKDVTELSDSQHLVSQNSDNVSENSLLQDDQGKQEISLVAKDVPAPPDSQNVVSPVGDNFCEGALLQDVHGKNEDMDEQSNNDGTRIESEVLSTEINKAAELDQLFDWLQKSDESKLFEILNELSEEVLASLLQKVTESTASLRTENDIYEFSLKEDESVRNALEMLEMDDESRTSDGPYLLSYPAKCYFGKNRLSRLEKDFQQEKSKCLHKVQDLQFRLESLNISLEALKEAKENFTNKILRFGGRHPVTKKVILQKVVKFFDDSIKNKMAMANRYRIQIESDIMEHSKIVSQIKEQQKRLSKLDIMKYQMAELEHEKSCKSLLSHKNQLAKCKAKFSSVSQSVVETKKFLDREQLMMQEIHAALSKKEYTKCVMISEKARNDQKVKELNAAMRKIKLDPRRHGLPEVTEYALVKRENENLKQNIKHWKQKVAVVEQAKLLHLSALQKKSQHR